MPGRVAPGISWPLVQTFLFYKLIDYGVYQESALRVSAETFAPYGPGPVVLEGVDVVLRQFREQQRATAAPNIDLFLIGLSGTARVCQCEINRCAHRCHLRDIALIGRCPRAVWIDLGGRFEGSGSHARTEAKPL